MRTVQVANRRLIGVGLSFLALVQAVGCGQQEVLVPVRGERPPGLDLSGEWQLQDDFEAMQTRIDKAVMATDGVDERDLLRGMMSPDRDRNRRRSRSAKKVGGLVHVFLENGRQLRITQTDAGLFVAFDRSVVEEYRFGEARTVTTGGARAQRVSGWDDDAYVIETLDESGMKLTERYGLGDDGDTLIREITLRSAELNEITVLQTFRRRG